MTETTDSRDDEPAVDALAVTKPDGAPAPALAPAPATASGPAPAPDARDTQDRLRRIGLTAARALILLFITCTATAGVVIYQVHHTRALSPVDEATYVDYLAKVGDGHFIISRGEIFGDYAANAVACRGIGNIIPPRPTACNRPDPRPFKPANSANIDPPTYYVITDGVARTLIAVGVTDDLVNAGRLAGIFWGGTGLAALFLLCTLLGAPKISSALVCGAALATTGFWTRWSQITPHASDLLVGALAAIATLMWLQRRAPLWLLLLVGAVPVFVKASNVTIIATMVIFLLALALWPQRSWSRAGEEGVSRIRTRRELIMGAGLIVAGLALATVGWLLVREHYALTSAIDFPKFNVNHFDAKWLLHALGVFGGSFQGAVTSGIGLIVTIWILGSVVHQFSDRQGAVEIRSLSFAGLVMIAFGAWLYIISNYLLLHQFVLIPIRYGTTLMPVLFALAARNIRGRAAQSVALVFLIVLVVNVYVPL